jgi:uncharacterized protein with von Willebrand factor type A (vWA) domain
MYPFGSLPENLIAFANKLRRDHGFRIGPGELHDAARALEIVELGDQFAVRHALRPILSRTHDEAAVFDQAFTEFFFPGPPGAPQADLPSTRQELATAQTQHEEGGPGSSRRERQGDIEEEALDTAGGTRVPVAPAEPEAGAPADLTRASYSPLEGSDVALGPALAPAAPAWRDAARALVRRVHLGLSRRWAPAARGRRFDVRRTLRASVQTGGEALEARWLHRPKRAPRFVLLVDGSRSMDEYAATALELAVALATVTMRVETFTFSTSLRRVTDDVHRAAAGTTAHLEHLYKAWGGGTSIGVCLRDFLRRFGARSLSRDTVVIIASDGLDVGEPDVLRDAMRELHRRSAGTVWLNPLLQTPGYEPTAAGMSAAQPYIGTLAGLSSPGDLARLSRLVRVRR